MKSRQWRISCHCQKHQVERSWNGRPHCNERSLFWPGFPVSLYMLSGPRYVKLHFSKAWISLIKVLKGLKIQIYCTRYILGPLEKAEKPLYKMATLITTLLSGLLSIVSLLFSVLQLWQYYPNELMNASDHLFSLSLDKYPPYYLCSYTFAVKYPSLCLNFECIVFSQTAHVESH